MAGFTENFIYLPVSIRLGEFLVWLMDSLLPKIDSAAWSGVGLLNTIITFSSMCHLYGYRYISCIMC